MLRPSNVTLTTVLCRRWRRRRRDPGREQAQGAQGDGRPPPEAAQGQAEAPGAAGLASRGSDGVLRFARSRVPLNLQSEKPRPDERADERARSYGGPAVGFHSIIMHGFQAFVAFGQRARSTRPRPQLQRRGRLGDSEAEIWRESMTPCPRGDSSLELRLPWTGRPVAQCQGALPGTCGRQIRACIS